MGLNALGDIQNDLGFDRCCCFDKYMIFQWWFNKSLANSGWIFSYGPLLAAHSENFHCQFYLQSEALAVWLRFHRETNWSWIQENYYSLHLLFTGSHCLEFCHSISEFKYLPFSVYPPVFYPQRPSFPFSPFTFLLLFIFYLLCAFSFSSMLGLLCLFAGSVRRVTVCPLVSLLLCLF